MEKFFHLKENGTTVSTEIMAGLTTFFAMSYIIIVNPQILSSTGMPWGGVFLATIIAAIIGTLVMGLFANVPYAQAAGMGLNAFFTYTVCFGLGFKWQETLCMVFLCGLINIIITVTKIRKMIIQAIPEVLQNAIGGGIGLFVAYVGFLNVGFFTFTTKSAAKSGDTVQATPGLAVGPCALVCPGDGLCDRFAHRRREPDVRVAAILDATDLRRVDDLRFGGLRGFDGP